VRGFTENRKKNYRENETHRHLSMCNRQTFAISARGRSLTARVNFWSFTKARAFAHALGLKSNAEWRKYCKSGKMPDDLPAKPHHKYAGIGWAGMGDWLGTGNVSRQQIVLRGCKTWLLCGEKMWTRSYLPPIPATPEKPTEVKAPAELGSTDMAQPRSAPKPEVPMVEAFREVNHYRRQALPLSRP
jgi:hypothetical protein